MLMSCDPKDALTGGMSDNRCSMCVPDVIMDMFQAPTLLEDPFNNTADGNTGNGKQVNSSHEHEAVKD